MQCPWRKTSICLLFQIYTQTALEQPPNWCTDTYIRREENASLLEPYIDTIHIKCKFGYVYRWIYYVTSDNQGQTKIVWLKWKVDDKPKSKYSFSRKNNQNTFLLLNCFSVILFCKAACFTHSANPPVTTSAMQIYFYNLLCNAAALETFQVCSKTVVFFSPLFILLWAFLINCTSGIQKDSRTS